MDPRHRRQVRRTTVILVLVALALYVGFIAYAVMQRLHHH
jgi:hypothetical protein